VKVFNFSLMSPIGSEKDPNEVRQPANTATFVPFGNDYRGGVSLATGWLAAFLGGAEAIVVGQLTAPGGVKVYSSGSALQGGPKMYLHSAMEHNHSVDYYEIANFSPFGGKSGVNVATTSTTSGADLLVSGISTEDNTVEVLKYQLVRPTGDASALEAESVGKLSSMEGTLPSALGGD
jgi:hypothetical protein